MRELVLQPQSDIRSVRLWLAEQGWAIADEHVIYEEGKVYPMMRAVPAAGSPSRRSGACDPDGEALFLPDEEREDILSGLWEPDDRFPELTARELELRFGPVLLYRRPAELIPFLERSRLTNLRILEGLKGQDSESARAGREQREKELCCLEAALCVARNRLLP